MATARPTASEVAAEIATARPPVALTARTAGAEETELETFAKQGPWTWTWIMELEAYVPASRATPTA